MENPNTTDKENNRDKETDNKSNPVPNQPPLPRQQIEEPVRENQDSNQETTFGNYKVLCQYSFKRVPRRYDLIGVIIQAALALLTLITLILFYYSFQQQKWATDEALKRTDSANNLTKQALDITKLAYSRSVASASMDSIMTIRDTLARERNTKRELRAYVVVTNFKVVAAKKGFFVFNLFTTNTGKTPAQKVEVYFRYKLYGTGVYENDFKNIELPNPYIMVSTLGNGITDTSQLVISDPRIKTEKISEINDGNIVYFFGKINYFDVWGDKHCTRFCYESLPAGQPLIAVHKYYRYNDAD